MLDLIADINEQPASILANVAVLDEAYSSLPAWTAGRGDIVITGMATSLWTWHSAGLVLENGKIPAVIRDTSEYLRYGTAALDDGPLLVTSRSGESAEIIQILEAAKAGRPVIAMTATAGSSLAKASQNVLAFKAEERAFYNTKSYMVTQAIALAAAAGLAGRTDLAPMTWAKRLADELDAVVSAHQSSYDPVAEVVAPSRILLLTGRGHQIGVSQQAALDLQEGMRIGAMAVPGGLLRHGPMELVQAADSAILLMIPNDHMADRMVRAVSDLVSHGAKVAAIVSTGVELPKGVPFITIPASEPELQPMLFAAAFHKLNVSVGRAMGLSNIQPSLIPKVTRVE